MIENKLHILQTISDVDSGDYIISQYILKNWERLIEMKIGDIQKEIGVSQSTLNRFCKSLGFKNFTDFKYQLFFELSKNNYYESFAINNYDESVFELFRSKKRIIVLGESDDIASLLAYKTVFYAKHVLLLFKLNLESPLNILSHYNVNSKDIVIYVSMKKSNLQLQVDQLSFYSETVLWLKQNNIPYVYIGLMSQRNEFGGYYIEVKKEKCIRNRISKLCDIFEKIYKSL